jgi:paraquat-inducible protein A
MSVGRSASAASLSLASCHTCNLVLKMPSADHHPKVICPRCGASVHYRKPNSLARAWALTITAAILYIPANVLPITITTSLGKTQTDTIMSGVIFLIAHGSWPVAVLIFFASILVPVLKILLLFCLLFSVERKSTWRPVDRTRIYRITEAIGRWSMVDIYVVTILVALVSLGELASIQAGPGAIAFGSVVVTTMFAAMAFDPRLIWDVMENKE